MKKNRVTSSYIIKWLTVIQTKRERERKRIIKKIPTDWESERNKKENKSLRQNEDTRKEKKRKTIIYQKYVHRGDTKINKMKKWRKI